MSVRCNGQKLKSLRETKGYTQEKVAFSSKVNIRTVQRAERGAHVSLDTLADLAASLNAHPSDLAASRDADPPTLLWDETGQAPAYDRLTLRRCTTARDLLFTLENSTLLHLDCLVEPTGKNVQVLRSVVEALEKLMPPDPWDEEFHNSRGANTHPLSTRIATLAELHDHLESLAGEGLALFEAVYFAKAVMPIWEEGEVIIPDGKKPQGIAVSQIAIGHTSEDQVRVPQHDRWSVEVVKGRTRVSGEDRS